MIVALTPSEVSSLTSSLGRWELAEYFSTGFVTVGAIGEFIAEFTDWFTKEQKERKDRLGKYSALLLIVALAFELVCLVKTNHLSGLLIGSLNETAEREHFARVKLEERLNWRRVSPKQNESIKKSLASIDAAISVNIRTDMRDPESAQFALDLLDVFRKPGNVSGAGVGNTMSPPSRFGLWIDTLDPLESDARSVQVILTSNGIDVAGIRVNDVATVHSEEDKRAMYPQLILFVGFRPTPLDSNR